MKRLLFMLIVIPMLAGQLYGQEAIDTSIVAQIRDQALNHSQVMDIAFHLTDASGPRLSNSPGLVRAQEWAKMAMARWGLVNTVLEPWGVFGKGWELKKCYLALKEPYYKPLIAFPGAWTNGSEGPFTADVVLYHPKDSAEQSVYLGKVKGKILLYPRYGPIRIPFEPEATRYTDSELQKMATPTPIIYRRPSPGVKPVPHVRVTRPRVPRMLYDAEFNQQEGILGVLSSGPDNNDGTVFVASGGRHEWDQPLSPMSLALSYEDFHLIQRLLEDSIPVKLEGEVVCNEVAMDSLGYNVVGEIPGTDPVLKDQLVMLGGHLDSWQGATGATDNGAGASVMLEVVRILEALHIHPRRTIRIVLWSGEEEGLLGSMGYVKKHFGDRETKIWTKDQGKVSAYYNLDNGTGAFICNTIPRRHLYSCSG